MRPKHTPGTWNVSRLATPEYAPEYAIHAEGWGDLARVVGHNAKANASLISAAQDLLEALQALMLCVDRKRNRSEWVIALAAIQKATEAQP